jgi:ATP/maltotriose-dependent transcriptional regulator MalT
VTDVLAGRFGVTAVATEGVRLAQDVGLPGAAATYHASLAWFAAVEGDDDRCSSHLREIEDAALASGNALAIAVGAWAAALRALGRGRPEETIVRLRTLRAARPGAGHPLIALTSTADLVEACIRSREDEAAREAYDALAKFVRPGAPAWALALAARCRALLSNGRTAEHEFEKALDLHVDADRPFDTARTRLLLGEHLRRERRSLDARDHLRAALATFEALGARPWADRARSELRAAGETVNPRSPNILEQLTAQEQQVVEFVSQGLSNKEVAAQLFLSPRTVEYHLRKVFMKLGISSRTELIRLGVIDREVAETTV